MSVLTYMQRRRSGIYEFRRRLPRSLAGKPAPKHVQLAFAELVNPDTGRFKLEVVRSLGTSNEREAKRRDHQEALRVQAMFDEAERALSRGPAGAADLTDVDLAELTAAVRAELLAADETEREEGDDRRRVHSREDRLGWPYLVPVPEPSALGMQEDHFAVYDEHVADLRKEYRRAAARHDPKIVEAELRGALRRRGLSILPSSPDYHRAGLAVLQGHVEAFDAMAARNRGEHVATPQAAPERGPKLSEAFAAWKAGGGAAGTRKPGPGALREAEHAVRRFTELHGDVRLGDIDRTKARVFRDTMALVPKRLPVKLRTLPLRTLLSRHLSAYERRDGATINKLLGMLGAVLAKASGDGRMDGVPGWSNPFDKRLRLPLDDREPGREMFTPVELRAFFSSPVFSQGLRPAGGGGEAAFWFPLIGLLSGMRLEEIAGLRIRDLWQDEETGRWFFEASMKGGRSVKNAASVRQTPVHPELVRIGLLRYREGLLAGGASPEAPLWPGVKAAAGRPQSAAWSQWFGRYLRKAGGVPDRLKVFHSFRHTFKRMARDAGLSEEMHDALTGHSGSGVGRSYGRDRSGSFSLRQLAEAMDRVRAPLVELRSPHWAPGD